jgi:hypothetical protein|tara:strand:+ start:56 stop:1102 length:1047 start_codon:yes stop_codon:yes gene_type:complete
MKLYKLILFILIVFLKTGNVLSSNNVFDVNNIEIEKKGKTSYEVLANQAIQQGFNQLINKILLKKDIIKLQGLKFGEIKELVNYYQILNKVDNKITSEKTNFNISFDKDKIHNLFYKTGISYSEITDKELFILPILKKNNQIFIFNQNYFYNNWNEVVDTKLIEFILLLENIEIIQNINLNKKNLLNLDLRKLFSEYSGKNLALVLIEDENAKEKNIYLNVEILEKSIVKNIKFKRLNLSKEEFNKKIINEIKQELINLIKSQNLIDVTIPSFLNAQFKISKKNNLVELTSRLNKIDSIENIYIQEFNNKSVYLKIKYLGKMGKIIRQLKNQKIILNLINGQWSIKII